MIQLVAVEGRPEEEYLIRHLNLNVTPSVTEVFSWDLVASMWFCLS
jgi:hypothetical protein